MGAHKDSAEVVKFMTLLMQVKGRCNDNPDNLPRLAENDAEFRHLCGQLSWAADLLRMNERRHRQLFAAPVDPKFISAWRDYEDRFESVLSDILWDDLFHELERIDATPASTVDLRWKIADDDAVEQARAIEGAIDFAYEQASQAWRDFPEDFREGIEKGAVAYAQLKRDLGFDLRDVFRRRELVPFINIPRHVADKHGTAEVRPLYKNLQQAHEAFVFGAPFASLALMRSIVEALLRDHYHAQGRNLYERINDASECLPRGASVAALHRLRKLANQILHMDIDNDEGLPKIEPAQLEKDIVSLLFVLRALIEGVPQRQS